MTLCNHHFGNLEERAKELIMEDDKRMKLWEEHIANYEVREQLSKHFSFGNIDKALQNLEDTYEILNKIESLISPEFVNINNEEKTYEDILSDLNKLKTTSEIEKISDVTVAMKNKASEILKLFNEITFILKTELHLIKVIKEQIIQKEISKELLLKLFKMIFHQEAMLYKVFREETFREENKYIHAKIISIAKAIILEQEIKEEVEIDEEKFARNMITQMHPDETENEYRILSEDIFYELAKMASVSTPKDANILADIKRMKILMKEDEIMMNIVKKLRPSDNITQINSIILAFRQAYDLGHFLDLESLLATWTIIIERLN